MSRSRVQQILAGVLNHGAPVGGDLLGLLCAACVRELPVEGAGISLIDGQGVQLMVTATDEPARMLEELQFTLGEGPCIDAFRAGRPTCEPDMTTAAGAGRWQGFGPASADSGIAAVFAFPLQLGGIRLGVLDLYSSVPGALDAAQITEALAFTDAATVLLLYLQGEAPPGQLPRHMDSAWASRAEVHQATGMISVQAVVSLSDALALLRAHAFATGRSLSEVAGNVVARRLRFRLGEVNNE
jgi:hypothetical protein